MLKNNNQTAVKRLSCRILKQNRTRNIFAILAIVLTTFMFTSVFGIGFSLAQNMSVMMLRKQGTKTTITLKRPSGKQIEEAKRAENLNAAGIRIPAGVFMDSSGNIKVELVYYDKTEWEQNFMPAISDIEGSYPKKEQEIMLSRAALSSLEIKKPKKGMEVFLQGESGETKFFLSGWYTGYANATGEHQGLVSKAYTKALGLTVRKNGVLCLSAKTGRQDSLLEELLDVDLRNGQEFQSVYDVQDESGHTVLMMAAAIGMMGGIILLSGYLLIYNVMYISVTKDIRFYGMLKTIGASPSQIKKIVKMQSARLSLFGIPIGILLGVLASFVVVPFALSMFSMGTYSLMPKEISFHPLIYIGTILFAMATVKVSCTKPAKLAGKVSAVEALKYNGQSAVRGKSKKSTDGGKLYKMAFRNVFREKKRAFLVFASLFMGIMSFLAVDTFLGCMKLENYVDFYLPDDFTVHTMGEEKDIRAMVKEISAIQGITEVSVNRYTDVLLNPNEEAILPFLEIAFPKKEKRQGAVVAYKKAGDSKEEGYSVPVVAVSKTMIEKYNKRAGQKIDLARFEEGEVCLVGPVEEKKQAERVVGKTVTLTGIESKKQLAIEVGSCATYAEDGAVNIGYHWQVDGAPEYILVSKKALDKLTKKPIISNVIVNCKPEAERFVAKKMKEAVNASPCVRHLEIKSEMIEDFGSSMMAMNVIGGGISFVLIFIGIINFINVMLTGVFIRRNELAVMESVGMTKKQVKRMLIFEGGYYGVVTLALILTVGNVMIKIITDAARQIADYAVVYYPSALLAVTVAVIMAVCLIVPAVLYHMLSKESITERLRQTA